jgi:phage FluMu protein Com
MVDVKCKVCGKLLLKAVTFVGAIKCTKCKLIIEYNVQTNILYVTSGYDTLGVECLDTEQRIAVLPTR